MARSAPWTALATLLILVLPGCLDPSESDPLGNDPNQPLDARALRVGDYQDGEYVRQAVNTTGHNLHFSFGRGGEPPLITVRPLDDRRYTERWIESGKTAKDRFLRDFSAVEFRHRFTDMAPEEGQQGVRESTRVYDLATAKSVYYHSVSTAQFSHTSCLLIQCVSNKRNETRDAIIYELEGENLTFGSLAGAVLRAGKTTSFSEPFRSHDGTSGTRYLNYTALRLEDVRGERAMLVKPTMAYVAHRAAPSNTPAPPSSGVIPTAQKEQPKPVLYEWYGEKTSLPIRADIRIPFEFDGRVYWQNTTVEAEDVQATGVRIAWKSVAPLERLARMPGAEAVPYNQFLSTATSPLMHPLSDAWALLQLDPTLLTYRSHMTRTPGAAPFLLDYLPDAQHGAYTWQLVVGGPGELQGTLLESTFQTVANQRGVGAPTHNEKNANFWFFRPPKAGQSENLELTKFAHVYETVRKVAPAWKEPAIEVSLGTDRFAADDAALRPTASFYRPEAVAELYPGGLFGTLMAGMESVRIDVVDGGLVSINGDMAMWFNDWPRMRSVNNPLLATPLPDPSYLGLAPWKALDITRE